MSISTSTNPLDSGNKNQHTTNIGNASNPSTQEKGLGSSGDSQLLNDKAEKYLREVASIEDMPDAQDQQEMDETLRKESE